MTRAVLKRLPFLSLLLISPILSGHQDTTIEWKAPLADLEQRLGSFAYRRWPSSGRLARRHRGLTTSIATFAAAHLEMRLDVPNPLTDGSSHERLTQQLDQLTTVVDEAIKQRPAPHLTLDAWK